MTNAPRSILIINQSWANHGDEAAHKGLVRTLRERFPDASLSVLVFSRKVSALDMQLFRPHDVANLEYVHLKKPPPGRRLRWGSALGDRVAKLVLVLTSRRYRRIARMMRAADLIVSAPSGVDIGPYRNWRYLALLLLAVESSAPAAVFGISFGPLPEDDATDARFSALAQRVLSRLDFLSLRDQISQRDADRLGIPYVPTTDSAFLDSTLEPIPDSFREKLTGPFVVIVPNALDRWHSRYAGVGPRFFEELFSGLIEESLQRTSQVVLMPQLFGRRNDADYLAELRERFGPAERERILILPAECSCEVQKALVGQADALAGARYHSIVFSLHAQSPFLALSYERKIRGLVEQAGLSQYMVSLEDDPAGIDVKAVARLFGDIHERRAEIRQEVARKVVGIRAVATRAADVFAERFGAKP
ncbi:MAG: polysaccharide pyruvyl transferase family protein [Planctomycetota bacterium]|jgi:colanic acid/amylovoran biosynthesis protein